MPFDMTNSNYLSDLNARQKEAVLHTEGPLLVLAGAGSGKTKVITHRIAHIIENGLAPHHILAVTFTNKAASEMRERVMALIAKNPKTAASQNDSSPASDYSQGHNSGPLPNNETGKNTQQFVSLPVVTTFHSFCVRVLRENHRTLNIPKYFLIFDRSDSIKAIKKAMELAGYSPKQFEPKKILSMISRAKGDAHSRLEWQDAASTYPEQVAGEVWEHYEKLLRVEGALDFDDLLFKTLNLIKEYPAVREVLQNRYQYLHIDEYQDTNKVQYEIIRLIAGDKQNICVVGDIDQNIYSWRGADIKNVLQFEKHFPGAHTVLLEENYRSTQTIIAASNDVIKKNRNRVDKTVFTSNQEGEKLVVFAGMTGADEAEYIAMTAKSLIADGADPADIAILFRTNFQSRSLEEAFLNFEVPYQVLGTKFFERKEVKDILSFVRLALHPGSVTDLTRVINVPPRGIGKITLLKLVNDERDKLKGATLEKVKKFEEMMIDIAKVLNTQKPSTALKEIMKMTGLEEMYKESGTEDDLMRLENLQELVTLAIRYDEHPPEEALGLLLEAAALQSDQDELKDKQENNSVRLMTIHAAKGLEFPYVFITGLEEGLFPHERIDDGRIDQEEERRLFYVALTRAEKKIWLTYAHMRTIFGSQRINSPSSFLSDIGEEHLEGSENFGDDSSSGFERTILLD